MVIQTDKKQIVNPRSDSVQQDAPGAPEPGHGSFPSDLRSQFSISERALITQESAVPTSSDGRYTDKDLIAQFSTGLGLGAATEYGSPLNAKTGVLMAKWEELELTKLPEDMKKLWKEG